MIVSMKSGLEGRNNNIYKRVMGYTPGGLIEVRPRRPEQSRLWCEAELSK